MSPWRGTGPGAVEGVAGRGGQQSLCHCGCLQRHQASGAGAFVGKNTPKKPQTKPKTKTPPPSPNQIHQKNPHIFFLFFFCLFKFFPFLFFFFIVWFFLFFFIILSPFLLNFFFLLSLLLFFFLLFFPSFSFFFPLLPQSSRFPWRPAKMVDGARPQAGWSPRLAQHQQTGAGHPASRSFVSTQHLSPFRRVKPSLLRVSQMFPALKAALIIC